MSTVWVLTVLSVPVLAGGLLAYLRHRRREARRLYRRHLEQALADGILTPEEARELEAVRREGDLTEAEVRMVALSLYRRALQQVAADWRLTPEEEAALARLREQLGLSEADLAADADQLRRLRLIAQVERGELPEVASPVALAPGETCHWAVRASLCTRLGIGARHGVGPAGEQFLVAGSEPFQVRGRREALGADPAVLPVDLGMLVVTSRRTIFRGAKRRLDLPHLRLHSLTLYADGVGLVLAGAPARRHDFLADDPELTAAILLRAARLRQGQVTGALPAAAP